MDAIEEQIREHVNEAKVYARDRSLDLDAKLRGELDKALPMVMSDLETKIESRVKNLEANYRKVEDVSGATILGDGRVALILDVASLVRRSRH